MNEVALFKWNFKEVVADDSGGKRAEFKII